MTTQEPPKESDPNSSICDCEEDMRYACASEGFYKEKEGKRYCVLHYPGKEKVEEFGVVLKKKLESKDFDFSGVWFPDRVDFEHVHFSADADFVSATFRGNADFSLASFSGNADFSLASFSGNADFVSATFRGNADFSSARFGKDADFSFASFDADANFSYARFGNDADFNFARFSGNAGFGSASFSGNADFDSASFEEKAIFDSANFSENANFSSAIFNAAAIFRSASFRGNAYFRFVGSLQKRTLDDQQRIIFQFANFEKPELVSFRTLDLKPHMFVNIDSRKFEFIDVEFRFDLNEELKSLKNARIGASHRLLAIACRQLADNAETNHRYQEASRLRFSSFEARRLEKFYGFVPWRLDWWYWMASGYGENVLRAFIVFVVLIGLCTIGYKNADFDPTGKTAITKPMSAAGNSSPDIPDTQPRRLGWKESALYSFNVSMLQKPEPRPIGLWGNALVSLETVLGPAQAALLALALRRKFMR